MILVGLLQPAQLEQFLAWRGQDAYTLKVVRAEVNSFFSGERKIWVASEGEELVGTVQLSVFHEDLSLARGASSAYIQALEVKPEHRKRGVGKALMDSLEEAARGSGFNKLTLMVELDNHVARTFYTALGYTEFKRSSWSWKGVEYPTICLEKHL